MIEDGKLFFTFLFVDQLKNVLLIRLSQHAIQLYKRYFDRHFGNIRLKYLFTSGVSLVVQVIVTMLPIGTRLPDSCNQQQPFAVNKRHVSSGNRIVKITGKQKPNWYKLSDHLFRTANTGSCPFSVHLLWPSIRLCTRPDTYRPRVSIAVHLKRLLCSMMTKHYKKRTRPPLWRG